MSFAKNLAKGFVRSAVNQVGRDGGRVISTSIYDGRNYVPVSNVAQTNTHQHNPSTPAGAVITNKPLSTGKIILFVILSLFLFPIGSIGVAIFGLVKYLDKNAKMEWAETVPQYTQDRRYKTNQRYIGDAVVKHKITVAASPEVIAINKKNGITALAIGIGCGLLIGASLLFN